MEKEVFNLLVDISTKGLIHIENPELRNMDQGKAEIEKYRQLKYLLREGLISDSGNEIYVRTESTPKTPFRVILVKIYY